MKGKVHVTVPFTTQVACGAPSHTANGGYREHITCKLCRKTALFKTLPTIPRKYREGRQR